MKWKLGNNYYSARLQIFNPSDLDKDQVQAEIAEHKYHIYLICKRPKMIFMRCDTSNEGYNESYFYALNESHDKVFFSQKHTKQLDIYPLSRDYYQVNNEGNVKEIRDFIVANSLYYIEANTDGTSIKQKLPTDLEVMYVGQAFGKKSRKKIDYRLSNHDKIQKIALKILNDSTFDDVLVIGVCIEVSDLTSAFVPYDPSKKQTGHKFSVDDLLNLQNKAKQRIPEDQEVTVFEASLINYFQPKYNIEYKEGFPAPGFSSYEEIYKTDFDYISMTIDTNPTGARIYSENNPEFKYIHHKSFPLKTKDQKKNFFDFLFE